MQNILDIINIAFWHLFHSIIREVHNINIILRNLSLKITSKKLNKKEILFNYLYKSKI